MVQDLVDFIHGEYPWASEDAALRLAELTRSSNIKSSALAIAMTQLFDKSEADKIKRMIAAGLTDMKNDQKQAEANSKKAKDIISDGFGVLGSTSGLESIAKITYAGTSVLGQGANSLLNMGNSSSLLSKGLRSTGKGLVGLGVGTAALGVVFTKLMSEQEKTLRSMIDFGLTVADTSLYTDLRGRVANLGMSLNDFMEVAGQTKTAMTSLTKNTFNGQMEFAKFAQAAYTDNEVNKFGYGIQDYTRGLAQEVSSLFELNQIQQWNTGAQKRVLDSFDTVGRISTFMANTMGIQRSEQMRIRTESRENEDFKFALYQNGQYIQNTYGPDAEQNIIEFQDQLVTTLTSGLGADIAEEVRQIFVGSLADIQLDTSVLNNTTSEFASKLQTVSPKAFSVLMSLMEDGLVGKSSATDAILGARDFISAIRNSQRRLSTDQMGAEATQLAARAKLVPDSFFAITRQELEKGMDESAGLTRTAALTISQLSKIAITYKKAQNQLTPGFETTSALFENVTSAGMKFGDTWAELFGMETPTSLREQKRLKELNEANIKSSGAKSAYYASMGGSSKFQPQGKFVAASQNIQGAMITAQNKQTKLDNANKILQKAHNAMKPFREQAARKEDRANSAMEKILERIKEAESELANASSANYENTIKSIQKQIKQSVINRDYASANILRKKLQDTQINQAMLDTGVLDQNLKALKDRYALKLAERDTIVALNAQLISQQTEINRIKIARLTRERNNALNASNIANQAYLNSQETLKALSIVGGDAISSDSSAPMISAPGSGISTLLDFISSGEGGYDSSNRGTSNGKIIGSDHATLRNNKTLSNLTIGEIMELQTINNPFNTQRLFAVGRYQIIPSTLKEIFPHSGLSLSDKFSHENQDILGKLLLQGNNGYAKRPALASFLAGNSNNLHAAMLEFSMEWASMPNPNTGQSYYGQGNASSHTIEQVKSALLQSRAENQVQPQSVEVPSLAEARIKKTKLEQQLSELNRPISENIAYSEQNLVERKQKIKSLDTEINKTIELINKLLSEQNANEVING